MTSSLPQEKVIYPEGCFFQNVGKPLLGCDPTLLTAPPLESPWTMHKTNFHPSRGYKKPNLGSIASFFRDTGVCPRICLWGSGKKFERLWRKKALALFCQDLCFLNSFIPKPVTSLLLKKKKPNPNKMCKPPYSVPTAFSLPVYFSPGPQTPWEVGRPLLRGQWCGVQGGAEGGLRAQTQASPRGRVDSGGTITWWRVLESQPSR